jgi:hypothetical protein
MTFADDTTAIHDGHATSTNYPAQLSLQLTCILTHVTNRLTRDTILTDELKHTRNLLAHVQVGISANSLTPHSYMINAIFIVI